MASRFEARSDLRHHGFAVLCAVVATASAVAQPDLCGGALPVPGAAASAPADSGSKFKLIALQCRDLAESAPARRAAQADLSSQPVTITMPQIAPAAPAPTAAAGAVPVDTTPPDRNAARVLSLAPALTAAARDYDIDPLLLHAIAHIESRHNAQAVSPVGARGVMQMMPATARRFGVDDEHTLFDADTNLRASAAYLRTLRSRYGDDLSLVLAAYNAGEGAVAKHGGTVPPYAETQAYVRDVLAVYRGLTEAFTVSKSGALVARATVQPAGRNANGDAGDVRFASPATYVQREAQP